MSKSLIVAIVCFATSATITFQAESKLFIEGSSLPVIEVAPETSSGLNAIYVVNNLQGIRIGYEPEDSQSLKWEVYSNLGGGYAQESQIHKDGSIYFLDQPESDKGYIITDGAKRFYFWLTDYNGKEFNITSIEPSPEQECGSTLMDIKANATPIYYYSLTGRQMILDREISLSYHNLEWDNDNKQYVQSEIRTSLTYLNEELSIVPPIYCSTNVHIAGDRFLRAWNLEKECISSTVIPHSVDSETIAAQQSLVGENSNQISNNNAEDLGGSAPAEIQFSAFVTDAVIHCEWQISHDNEFENIDYRFNQQDLDFTFNEDGVFYVRFIGSNSDGSCETIGTTYTVNIGSSELLCPNAFSPDGDGINDEWKVSYRSIIDFKCWIFDRQGREMYHFDSPDGGWDGKHNGRLVRPGVYYYVVQATGADGKKYKKSGDINIIRHRQIPTTSSGGDL